MVVLRFAKIQSNASLRTRDLLTQPLLELLHIHNQTVIISLQRREIVLLDELKLRLELRKVDLLGVSVLEGPRNPFVRIQSPCRASDTRAIGGEIQGFTGSTAGEGPARLVSRFLRDIVSDSFALR